MALAFKEVARQCIGQCSSQNVIISIDGKYASLTGLLQTVQSLAQGTRAIELTRLLSALVRLIHSLTDIARVQGVTITPAEMDVIKNAIKNYNGKCDLYFMLNKKDSPIPDVLLSRNETEELYRKKAGAATTVESKSHYSAVMNEIATLYSQMADISDALTAARAVLQRFEAPITPEERIRRGYNLAPEQRAEKNAELLRSSTMGGAPTSEYTVGSFFIPVPDMMQQHCVLAIDMLTGIIFVPQEVVRHERYVYEAKEKDIAQFDYVYARPLPSEQQVITLPRDYTLLPLRMGITTRDLSAEAKEVIAITKEKLFKPALLSISRALEYTREPSLYAKLSKVRRIMQSELAQPL